LQSLAALLEEGFTEGKDLNCAESILYGGNQAYELGLDESSLNLAAGFGGGMGIEATCGALTGSIMVLSSLFVEDRAHDSRIYDIDEKFLREFEEKMGSIDCTPLKEGYRSEKRGCRDVILAAAEVLDDVLEEELGGLEG